MTLGFALGLFVGVVLVNGLVLLNQKMKLEDVNGRSMVSAGRNTRTTGEGK